MATSEQHEPYICDCWRTTFSMLCFLAANLPIREMVRKAQDQAGLSLSVKDFKASCALEKKGD
jgi:hypothetical protein